VRRVRMLGLCIAALFAMSAMLATAASARKSIKSLPETKENYEAYKNCPINNAEVNLCFLAISNGGNKGGQFTVGGVKVPLKAQLLVQGGSILNEETGQETFVAPENGQPAFYSPPLRVPGGLGRVKVPSTWPKALKEEWKAADGEGKEGFETPELVGQPGISRANLIEESGTALEVPLRIHITSPDSHLLGPNCYTGSASEPIVQRLTSGETHPPEGFMSIKGELGELVFGERFDNIRIRNNLVVDNTYAVPVVHGCGTPENEALVDEAIDTAFGLPAAAGASVTEVRGTLWNSTKEATREILFGLEP
jgi:hypothetical protein